MGWRGALRLAAEALRDTHQPQTGPVPPAEAAKHPQRLRERRGKRKENAPKQKPPKNATPDHLVKAWETTTWLGNVLRGFRRQGLPLILGGKIYCLHKTQHELLKPFLKRNKSIVNAIWIWLL